MFFEETIASRPLVGGVLIILSGPAYLSRFAPLPSPHLYRDAELRTHIPNFVAYIIPHDTIPGLETPRLTADVIG
jgi:hypothetical protein